MEAVISIEIGQQHFSSRPFTAAGCQTAIESMLQTLGITGTLLNVILTDSAVFITVNGQPCDFPPWLLNQVNEYIAAQDSAELDSDVQFWNLLLTQLLWLQPAVLLIPRHTLFYLPPMEQLLPEKADSIAGEFYKILVELLEMKISLADKDSILAISRKYIYLESIDWNIFREELVAQLAAGDIGICCNRDYFKQVIKAGAQNNFFEQTRNNLLNGTGVVYPDFSIEFDNTLPYHFFRFRVNHFYTMPVQGLYDANEVIANYSPEELKKLAISAKPITSATDGFTCSIISPEDEMKNKNAGFITLDATGYFAVCLSSFMSQYGYCTVTSRLVPEYLERAKDKYPELAGFFANPAAAGKLVKVLRLLVREELLVRQYSVIMEGILESDYIIVNGGQLLIADDRIPAPPATNDEWKDNPENLLAFVRTKLKRYIGYLYAPGVFSIRVYQVDFAIEDLLDPELNGDVHFAGPDLILAIRAAVDKHIGALAPGTPLPILLTTITARPRIKKIIAARYPRTPVLAYQEIPPELKLVIAAKIELAK